MNWISIDEALPTEKQPVLILTTYGKMATAFLSDKTKPDYGWTDWMRMQHSYGSVAYWMPLPELPTWIKIKLKSI